MAFQSFKQVGQRDTPNLIAAQAADDRMDAANDARKTRMMGQLAKGGASLYNEAMGDRSPIADYLGLSEPTGEFAGAVGDYAMPEALATEGVNTAALDAAITPEALTEALRFGAPEAATAGMNLAPTATALAAPEAAAGLEGLAALTAAPAATAGMNASTIGAALAPAAAESAALGAGAAGLGTAVPALGGVMALASILGWI